MKVELIKKPIKTAIVSYGQRITLDSSHVRTVDLLYLRKYMLEQLGRTEVNFVTRKTAADEKYPYLKDIRKTDLNCYDEVIIYNSTPNVFGGLFKEEAIDTFKALYDYNNGPIWYFFCEEIAYPSDFSCLVRYKKSNNKVKTTSGEVEITDEFCDAWSHKVYDNMKIIFTGDDYDAYVDRYNKIEKTGILADYGIKTIKSNCDWAFMPLFEFYSGSEDIDAKLSIYPPEREYDLVYYGNKRSGRRNKIISSLYDHKELKTMFIGYDPGYKNSKPDVLPYVSHDELFPMLCKSYATIILCSDSHNNIIRTPRFFEALNLDLVGFIWHEYNEDRSWIQNEELKRFIFVNSYGELKNKLNRIKNDKLFFRHIIELERKEANRWYKYSLSLYQ